MVRVALFGKFRMSRPEGKPACCHAAKVRELFSYLLLHRDRPQSREMLASLSWGDYCTTAQSKKYLRKALWQLQADLRQFDELAGCDFLHAEANWIELHSITELWLDVAIFEIVYATVKGTPGHRLEDKDLRLLEQTVQLYTGYLLENWYQDWCLADRERLHHLYLIMLDKLTSAHEVRHQYEEALVYGEQILQYDRARERTHQQIMRLYYQSGDRTSALRQYKHFVALLEEELDISPSRSTVALYEHIREDRGRPVVTAPATEGDLATGDVWAEVAHLRQRLATLQQQVQRIEKATEGIHGALYTSQNGQC